MEKVRRKRIGRRILGGVLSVALTLGLMPGNVLTVKAEESNSTAPSVTAFATPEQLMSSDNFALHSDYKGVAQKVYFGKNGDSKQTWYIAGSDADNSIVLLGDPALPMETDTVFEDDPSTEKTYESNWGCTYEAIFEEDEVVYPNHYGASDLRLSTLKALEKNTSIFTTSEQSIMQTTRVYTDDGKQRDDSSAEYTYYTEDVLYTAYGDYEDDGYITVGANSAGSLNDGLKVSLKSAPYNSGAEFWLRAPFFDVNGEHVLLARPGNSVGISIVNVDNAVVPAFRLNLSSVLFASAAPAATSDDVEVGTIAAGEAMTLRLNGSNSNIGSGVADVDNEIIRVTKGSTAGTVSLVVQGNDGTSDWYYSKMISADTTVYVSNIESALTSFGISDVDLSSCKIWLETTIDNVTYAVNIHMDEDSDGYCDECGKIVDGIGAKLAGYSLRLDGNIGVNFYMELDASVLEDDTAYMQFTLPNVAEPVKIYVNSVEGSTKVINSKTYYVFTCEVAAKEMTDTIKAQIFCSNGTKTGTEYEYSVREYAVSLLGRTGATDKEIALAKAMLNYGAYAQTYFGYNLNNPANAGYVDNTLAIDTSTLGSYVPKVDVTAGSALTYAGSTIRLEAELKVRHYFKLTDGATVPPGLNLYEAPANATVTDPYCYYESDGIAFANWGTKTDYTAVAGNSISYCPLSYVTTVVANTNADLTTGEEAVKLQNLMKALYLYYQAVQALGK